MATTTNYGWTTPDDTALVKDGAAAIRTLGSSVDTTTKALNPSTTLGDIEYRSSTANTNTRLPIGSSGNVLSVSGGVPAWTTPVTGGMTLLSTTSLSSTTTTISSISGAYNDLLLIISGASWTTFNTSYEIRPNGSSNGSFGGYVVNNAGSYSTTGFQDAGINSFNDNIPANNPNNVVAYTFFNYANTSYFKAFHGVGYFNKSSSGCTFNVGGAFKSNSAITSFDIVLGQSTSYTGGVALLYGVK
jgi:hypothetical protein